jgi:aryl-alcohol dehydrogenase-like predicted oxidoreductase
MIGSLEVSVVGLGANNFGTDFFGGTCDQDDATAIVDAALDSGVTLIDTAEEYSKRSAWGTGSSEQFIGVALGARRDDVVIASKFGIDNLDDPDEIGAERIVRAVEESLVRLGTDRIDLYQQHFPDLRVPIEEMLEALDRLVHDGKVREIGCCNFTGAMLDDAEVASDAHGWRRFVSAQNQYNVLDAPMQEGVLDACARHDLMFLPYLPLAGGLLTGKYRKDVAPSADSRFGSGGMVGDRMRNRLLTDERIAVVGRLDAFARERGHTLLELAFSWLTSQPVVASVIAGASRPDQVRANAAAADWELTPEDFAAIDAIVGR